MCCFCTGQRCLLLQNSKGSNQQRSRTALFEPKKKRVSRADITERILNDQICSRHFVSGKPADLIYDTNPDWLLSMNLGHRKKLKTAAAANPSTRKRLERREARESRQEAAESLLLLNATTEFEADTSQASEVGDDSLLAHKLIWCLTLQQI